MIEGGPTLQRQPLSLARRDLVSLCVVEPCVCCLAVLCVCVCMCAVYGLHSYLERGSAF